MSYSHNIASSEFTDLCQSQIKLLNKRLGAMWGAIYLTKEVAQSQEKQLLLFTTYPLYSSELPSQIKEIELPKFLQQITSQRKTTPHSLPVNSQQNENLLVSKIQKDSQTKELILPLVYGEKMMGLLIGKRKDRFWNQQELEEAKEIAKTIAIARFIEQQSQWYQEQLKIQKSINNWQQEQLGDLLHQLRNPLTALRTFSKLLIKRLLPENRNRSLAQNVLQQSDRLSELIDKFATEVEEQSSQIPPLTLSTTSVRLSEEIPPHNYNFLLPGSTEEITNIDINELLKTSIDTTRAIANAKKINLIADVPSNLPLVKGNLSALTEVLHNLLDNAVKYTPEKGQITVRIKQKDDLLGIAIEDSGYGIPEADKAHLFERHYRGVQAAGDIPGTGLGLAIAKQLIEQMQGKIEVISPNEISNDSDFPGTIFILWLSMVRTD